MLNPNFTQEVFYQFFKNIFSRFGKQIKTWTTVFWIYFLKLIWVRVCG